MTNVDLISELKEKTVGLFILNYISKLKMFANCETMLTGSILVYKHFNSNIFFSIHCIEKYVYIKVLKHVHLYIYINVLNLMKF